MVSRICLLLPVFCLILAITGLMSYVSPAYAAANVLLLDNHSGYLASDGKYHVAGEVQNQGTTAAAKAWVYVRFLDSSGNQINSLITSSLMSTMLPGRKSPFSLWEGSSNVHSYEIYNLTSSEASGQTLGLEITSHSWTKASGTITVTGTIKNIGEFKARALHVVCTFYDSIGHVVGAENALLGDTPLDSQQERPFTIVEHTDPGRELIYADYELTAESNEYALVPEYSPSVVLAILAVILTSVALTKRRARA